MEYSLEELENTSREEPEHTSSLVINCRRLLKIPLKDLDTENIRMLVGQKIGLKYLMPLALDFLEHDHFCSGDFYNGDLLSAVLSVDSGYWNENNELFYRLSDIMFNLEESYETYLKLILPKWKKLDERKKITY